MEVIINSMPRKHVTYLDEEEPSVKKTATAAVVVLLVYAWMAVPAGAATPQALLGQVGQVPANWQEAQKGCVDKGLRSELKTELKKLETARSDVRKSAPKRGGPPPMPSQEDMAAMQDMAQWMMHRQEEDSDFNRGVEQVRKTFRSEAATLDNHLSSIRSEVEKKVPCEQGDAACKAKREAEIRKRSLAAVDTYLQRAGATFKQYRALVQQHLDVIRQNIPASSEKSSFPAVVLQMTTVKSDMYKAVQALDAQLADICGTADKAAKPFKG